MRRAVVALVFAAGLVVAPAASAGHESADRAVTTRSAFVTLDPALTISEAQLCFVLAAQSPGTPPATIDLTGDTDIAGHLVWDCPPYQEW